MYVYNLTFKTAYMKKLISNSYQRLILSITTMLVSVLAFAQDKGLDIDINTKSEESSFFSQPWVWIVGAAVFILLLVALIRGKK